MKPDTSASDNNDDMIPKRNMYMPNYNFITNKINFLFQFKKLKKKKNNLIR